MINIDGIYTSTTYNGARGEADPDGNRFRQYVMYGNRLLAKVYSLGDDDVNGSIILIMKNGHFKKYKVYGYYQQSTVIGFILGVLYNGERESDEPGDVSNLPV